MYDAEINPDMGEGDTKCHLSGLECSRWRLAVFFFFETAVAGIKSASVYVENDSAGGKSSGILKPGSALAGF